MRAATARWAVIDGAFDILMADLVESGVFPDGTRKTGNPKNEFYIDFCVLKHMLKSGRPRSVQKGQATRIQCTYQQMVDVVMNELKKTVIKG